MAQYCTVKNLQADGHQLGNLTLLCNMARQRGATGNQTAGAMATMIQESGARNLKGGDRDSMGLYQQRPSMGWGSPAQVTNPSYAIDKFLTPYLAACRRGMDVIAASHSVQRSAFASAPAKWMTESQRNVQLLTGSGDRTDAMTAGAGTGGTDAGGGSQSITTTRTLPYEFSRGSPDNAGETTWDAAGRLASETGWVRFMRAGRLYVCSEDFLANQAVRWTIGEFSTGVQNIAFNADNRRNAAECTVTANAERWAVLPGDLMEINGQGPGNGKWLVSKTRRAVNTRAVEITLKRASPALPEPAPTQETSTITVGGVQTDSLNPMAVSAGAAAAPTPAQTVYNAAKQISDKHMPYVWGGGHGRAGTPSGGGFDCSGSSVAVLAAAGLGYRLGGPVDVSGTMAARWGQAGRGQHFTVWANATHVWIQFHGQPAWRFDTSPNGCGGSGPQLRFCARSTSGFQARHWPGL